MLSKILLATVLAVMSVGCISANPDGTSAVGMDDVFSYVGEKMAQTTQIVQAGQNAALAAIAEQNKKIEEAKATIASMEEIVGPADTDKDGVISDQEATDFVARMATSTDPRAQTPGKQSETYTALLAYLAASLASRKLGHKLPPSLQFITAILGSPTKSKS